MTKGNIDFISNTIL